MTSHQQTNIIKGGAAAALLGVLKMGNSVSREEFDAVRQEEKKLRNRLRELEERLNQPRPVAQHRNPGDQQVGYISYFTSMIIYIYLFIYLYIYIYNPNGRRLELNSWQNFAIVGFLYMYMALGNDPVKFTHIPSEVS